MKRALPHTWPGRALAIGLAVKLVVAALGFAGVLSSFLSFIDTCASITLVAGGVYFVAKGVSLANRRLLWRVRRKLIISYIFIGFIPSALIVVFFLLGGLFLFSNVSSYLVQNQFRALEDDAMAIASSQALLIQRSQGRDLESQLAKALRPDLPFSIAAFPMNPTCASQPVDSGSYRPVTAGPWQHVQPPSKVPEWLADCNPFAGIVSYQAVRADVGMGSPAVGVAGASSAEVGLIIRAVAFANRTGNSRAVVVDIVVDDAVRRRLRAETGVELTRFQPAAGSVQPLEARPAMPDPAAVPPTSTLPLTSVTLIEDRDWQTGARGSVLATMQLSIPDIYRRISTQAPGSERFSRSLLVLLMVIGCLFLILQVLALIVGLVLARSITGSVHELFVGTERVRKGDFTNKINIRARDQLGELGESFNQMTESIESLLSEQAEKKRLEEELRIAHEIQMSLLPQGPLGMRGLSVTAISVPAREVGGDYYDFLPLDDHRVGVLVADVSGKGTSAALYMAELKGLMLSLTRIHSSPRELLIAANRIIAEHLDARSFITMTYAVLDLRARTITYARAGHTPLVYLPATGPNRDLRLLTPDGLVLGLKLDNGEMFERLLVEETMTIHAGDLLLLFTDGITEAMDASDDCFGETRLGQIIEAHAHLPAEELRERVLREIAAFVGDTPQHDDMTLLLIRIGEPDAGTADVPVHAQAAVLAGA